MTGDTGKLVRLCALDDIPDGDSNGFFLEADGTWHNLFAVRHGEAVVVYVNSCPHTGAPLNFLPGKFLDVDKTAILCTNHAALFRIEDGHCIHGPCVGKGLTALSATVQGVEVFIAFPVEG